MTLSVDAIRERLERYDQAVAQRTEALDYCKARDALLGAAPEDIRWLLDQLQACRQGLWDCFRYAGGDTDYTATEYLIPLTVECVKSLREEWDDDTELESLRRERDQLAAVLKDLIDGTGIELDDQRLGYIVAQIGRAEWEQAREALRAGGGE